jgi:hypothetical protein
MIAWILWLKTIHTHTDRHTLHQVKLKPFEALIYHTLLLLLPLPSSLLLLVVTEKALRDAQSSKETLDRMVKTR